MTRQPYATQKVRLVGPAQQESTIAKIRNAPIDPDKPLEVIIREEIQARKLDQNALMWVGPLRDIEMQAYVDGRTYRDIVWHEHFKELFLPEGDEPNIAELVKDADKYIKWSVTPSGRRILAGSTTELTKKGFSIYLEQIYAFGANLGVQFSANPDERRAA